MNPIIKWILVFIGLDLLIFCVSVAYHFFVTRRCDTDLSACQVLIEKSIYFLYWPVSLLSCSVSLWTLQSFFRRKALHKQMHLRFVMLLAISDFMFSLEFLVSSSAILFGGNFDFTTTGTWQCNLMGFLGQTFGTSNVGWNVVIVTNLFIVVRYPFTYQRIVRGSMFLASNVLVWSLSFGQGLVALSLNAYMRMQDGTCYVNLPFLWASFDVVFLVAIVWGVFVISYALMTLRKRAAAARRVIVDAVCFSMAMLCAWFFNILLYLLPGMGLSSMAVNNW